MSHIIRQLAKIDWGLLLSRKSCVTAPIYSRNSFYPVSSLVFHKINARMASTVGSASFDEIKNVKESGDYLIDVRERDELRETGVIPDSINIPLGEIQAALTDLPPELFLQKYGREKPVNETRLVFSCRSGRRSDMAAQLALQLGYKCVRNYNGGWLDWENKLKAMKN